MQCTEPCPCSAGVGRAVAGKGAARSLLAALFALGCAHHAAVVNAPTALAPEAPRVATEREAARTRLIDGLQNVADRSHAREVGVHLAAANGARTLTGEASADERLRAVTLLTSDEDAMALFATSDCGNAWLIGMRFAHARWEPADLVPLVGDARPGQCRTTDARAEARAMETPARREIVAVFGSQSEEGDESRAPVLQVFQLGHDGRIRPLSEALAFGSDGDANGVIEDGEWIVDEALSLPRDLFVQIRPRTLVRGGPHESVRRVYRLRAGRIEQVDEAREPLRAGSGDR